MAESSLIIITQASRMLAEADTIQKAKELKDLALTAQDWAKRKGLGKEAIQYARSYAFEAERRMGELLQETERAKGELFRGTQKEPREDIPTLSIFKQSQKSKSKKKVLIKALDDLVSKQVRERDGYKCRRCGRIAINKNDVAHHHIFTKTRLTTRWDERNGLTLDFFCHRWAHAAGEEFRRWVLSFMSQVEYDAMYIKSQMRGGYKTCDLELLLKMMRREEKERDKENGKAIV